MKTKNLIKEIRGLLNPDRRPDVLVFDSSENEDGKYDYLDAAMTLHKLSKEQCESVAMALNPKRVIWIFESY